MSLYEQIKGLNAKEQKQMQKFINKCLRRRNRKAKAEYEREQDDEHITN